MKCRSWMLAAISLALAGCGNEEGGEPSASVLRVNIGAEVQDLDPHVTTGVPEHRVLSALFEGLTDIDMASMEPVPGAAESWTISEDGLVYAFKIRENAKWSNGEPLTAGDFVYSWQRMLTPALGAEYATFLYLLKNGEEYNKGQLTDSSQVGVKALDDHTLEVTLAHPASFFLSVHNHQAWYPVHRATIEKFGSAEERGNRWTRAGNHVGNGPFLLEEWRPNEFIRVRKNPNYWDTQQVHLEGIEFYPIQDLQTEERSFRSGKLQWTQEVPLHQVKVYQVEHPELITVHPYLGTYYYRLNVTRPGLNDVRVRRALSLALDREELTRNVLQAGEAPAFHFVPPEIKGYTSTSTVEYDPEKARQLLAEAGYPQGQGFPALEILYNTMESHKTIAETVQRMWKEQLGINVQLLNQDWKVYLDNLNSLNYDVARSGWISDFVDPLNFLETMLSNSGNNRTGWKSEAFDQLIAQSNATASPAERMRFLQQAEALLLEEMPLIPMYFYTRKYLIAPEVKGYVPNPLGYIRWKDIYLEQPQP
ncbi:MAG: peptide ABC transporter substrate-binding protein [Candidatus Hydrogenedentes bacterium]|nr:peptide ABC transporter substrate-binding protein [Candidatus Hydrogenedentota bacterium]